MFVCLVDCLFFVFTGKPQEAEELGTRALSIVEKAYGPMHPELATCLNNLSALLHARRYCTLEAISCYKVVNAVNRRHCTPEGIAH